MTLMRDANSCTVIYYYWLVIFCQPGHNCHNHSEMRFLNLILSPITKNNDTHKRERKERGKTSLFVCFFPPNQLQVIKMHAWITTRWKQCYTTPISGIYLGDYRGGSLCIHSTQLNDKKGEPKTSFVS